MGDIVCVEHDCNVEVEDQIDHLGSIEFIGWCLEDGGHEVVVWEY